MKKLCGSVCAMVVLTAGLAGCDPFRGEARTWAPEQKNITGELAGHTWPLVTEEGALDVGPLWEMTRAARIVGIGEASPGVREHRKLMNAMVQRAADDGKPLVVALDLPLADGLKLDAWVGDAWYPPDPKLKSRQFEDTEAFDTDRLEFTRDHLNLLTWIRAYNQGAPPERDIRVVGLDACVDPTCAAWLAGYFDRVDPGSAADAWRLFSWLRLDGTLAQRTPEYVDAARRILAAEQARLTEARAQHVAAVGADAHATALRVVKAIGRRLDPSLAENGAGAEREPGELMADTVVWLSEQVPGARILVLANNAHTDRPASDRPDNLGRRLTERFAGEYVVVHATFNRGFTFAMRQTQASGFNHRDQPGGSGIAGGASDVALTGWAPPGTLEDVLRVPGDGYAMDVREAAASGGTLADYLRKPHFTRWYPRTWRGKLDGGPKGWTTLTPAAACDVLVYVTSATVIR